MGPSPIASISEHWLTFMTCVVCESTPDESPVYLCNLGHTICLNCFKRMTKSGMPKCTICQSTKFKAKAVSCDFLKKLKMKPGIGRPYRYVVRPSRSPSPSPSNVYDMENKDDTVTVEKLFQLPSEKIQELFDRTTKQKLKKIQDDHLSIASCKCCKNKKAIQQSWNLIKDESSEWFLKKFQKPMIKEYSSTAMCSRKPLRCPHNPCNKIIAMSSFNTHFVHEHADIPRLQIGRGKELEIIFDPSLLEYNTTYCLGLATLYSGGDAPPEVTPVVSKVSRIFNQTIPVETFWVMVSGSSEAKKTHAYVIFWLFTNNDDFYNCTLELESQREEMSYSAFCSVNGMHDSHDIKEVVQRMNCLYVTYGGLESLLAYGPNPKFRISIH